MISASISEMFDYFSMHGIPISNFNLGNLHGLGRLCTVRLFFNRPATAQWLQHMYNDLHNVDYAA